ncbi:substrate-binding domain-containing protein [Streptomyces sp. P9-A2]|uniref:substrate-binding domain-containing protein n=1 Tax=Streptomyces sp. P9-A2 TaxID=3072284 RepID=UPI003FCE8D83
MLRAGIDLGLRVPEDLAAIGYDATQYAELSTPALTTVHVDAEAHGRPHRTHRPGAGSRRSPGTDRACCKASPPELRRDTGVATAARPRPRPAPRPAR